MTQYSLIDKKDFSVSAGNTNLNTSYPRIIKQLEPTEVYNLYWYFASERQKVFFSKHEGAVRPWTNDPIINKYKFTNAYRASDRVSQYLIKDVIYNGDSSLDEVFFRTILFKIFNKIETWEILLNSLKEISLKSFDFNRYDSVLSKAMADGNKIYSAAYIMPAGGSFSPHTKKHRVHIELIKLMMKLDLRPQLSNASSLEECYELLKSLPTIGPFLAFQYAIDLNYSPVVNFDENDFVVAGPGAVSGINKCFNNLKGYSYSDVIKMMCDIQDDEFKRLELNFKNLWGRKLHLIDCQNLFCETDKYSRVACPNVVYGANRVRIKQLYKQTIRKINYYFPPKWNIEVI